MRRCACTCNDVGCCGGLQAGGTSRSEDFHKSPTGSARLARRRRSDVIASHRAPLGLLHPIWRIRTRGLVDLVMIDRAFMARLWKSIRSAVHEFKISRMQKRSNRRFRVVEVSKRERRRFSSSYRQPPLSTRCLKIKRSVRRGAGRAVNAVVGCPRATANTYASWELIPAGRAEENDDEDDTEEESVTDESAPINWTRWKEIEIGEFSPRVEIAPISSSKSMEEFGSLKWEEGFLTTSASTRSAHQRGEGRGEGSSVASSTGFEHRRWENRYRLSNKSPQLLQPVRGKLTTLSSLLRTMSDRYARRTGKLTPLHDRSNHNINNNTMPVLMQSQPAVLWPKQEQQNHHRTNSTSRIVDDVPAKRYDNPFQDFLRQSFAERHSRSSHETDRQR